LLEVQNKNSVLISFPHSYYTF